MTTKRAPGKAPTTPTSKTALTDRGAAPWSLAKKRLEKPEQGHIFWFATVAPDGAPHLMPLIGTWVDGAFCFLTGEKTRKGRNLANESRCVVGGSSTNLPSLDLIVQGTAKRVTDGPTLRRVIGVFRKKMKWPLEVHDGRVVGPNAPTAGPPPYALYRVTPSTVFGLPGTAGMDKVDPEDLPRPTRWDFTRAVSRRPAS